MTPLGVDVHYVSRTGTYELAAKVAATPATLNTKNVDAGLIAGLTGPDNVHLIVFSPGPSGRRADATDFVVENPHGRSENVGGTYTELDIAPDAHGAPGTWHDPMLCPFGVDGGLPK